ncbi:hypothetical protein [Methylobacterium iners]|uniref:hypothetical protein n=1 Tax=Methylobacterium iners TaxID=418707 RepID=UPI001EE3494D|nr:hypothetical protein [Methylobacterium iners]
MIWALVLEKQGDALEPAAHRGRYGFEQIPARGDHVEIAQGADQMDLLEVLTVQHTPIREETDLGDGVRIALICELLGSYPA